MRLIYDDLTDPYRHIALEHYYLYEDKDIEQSPVLLIYRNDDSVVFGNFQNPWLETDVKYCLENNINFVRRFSGGGCVYHDGGNINFCYIGPRCEDAKNVLTHRLISFFNKMNIVVVLGQKSDLLLNGHKISGSAFRETKKRVLHHCTLLFNSDLERLKRCLISPLKKNRVITQALPSRPAIVSNLSQFSWKDPQDLIESFLRFEKSCHENSFTDLPSFTLDSSPWKSWDYVWGKTPRFLIDWEDRCIEIENAILKNVFKNSEVLDTFNISCPLNQKSWNYDVFKNQSEEFVVFLRQMGFIHS